MDIHAKHSKKRKRHYEGQREITSIVSSNVSRICDDGGNTVLNIRYNSDKVNKRDNDRACSQEILADKRREIKRAKDSSKHEQDIADEIPAGRQEDNIIIVEQEDGILQSQTDVGVINIPEVSGLREIVSKSIPEIKSIDTSNVDRICDGRNTVLKKVNNSDEVNEREIDRACSQAAITREIESAKDRSKLEQDFADELLAGRKQDSLKIAEIEDRILQSRKGTLPDSTSHNFGAIYKEMPEPRRRFTVQLVRLYAWFKEEMSKSMAKSVAHKCLPRRFVEHLKYTCTTRAQYVGKCLKMILRCDNEHIEEKFLSALRMEGNEGFNFAEMVANLRVTKDDIKAFEQVQRERSEYQISTYMLPHVCIHSLEVDIINDHLFSRIFFSYKEHSDIDEHNSNGKCSLFFETLRKCHPHALDEFKVICAENRITTAENTQQVEEVETVTDVIINEHPCLPSLESIGSETVHMHEGSLFLTLKLKDEQARINLREKCEDGSIGDVLFDLLQSERVSDKLHCDTYDLNITLRAINEDANYVEMQIEGDPFEKKEQMCKQICGNKCHPLHICEELEITESLLDSLQRQGLLLENISHILLAKKNRRDRIHELLCNYNTLEDEGFKILCEHIRIVRQLLGEKVYPLTLFKGTFILTKKDREMTVSGDVIVTYPAMGSFEIVYKSCAWLFPSFAGRSEGHAVQTTLKPVVHVDFFEDDKACANMLFKWIVKSSRRCSMSEVTFMRKQLSHQTQKILLFCGQHMNQYVGNFMIELCLRFMWTEDTIRPLKIAVCHENESTCDAIKSLMDRGTSKPYTIHCINPIDKSCLQLLELDKIETTDLIPAVGEGLPAGIHDRPIATKGYMKTAEWRRLHKTLRNTNRIREDQEKLQTRNSLARQIEILRDKNKLIG
ncbi:uncharacterized protein LOC128234404 isoform X2 [Mya arenaria]|uniref:uncharacterized protein LOC128234404 isoform X2 n=1 Tax=Mya arenaria TaxID=6604 RepID=UPI0022E08DDE|nr:uncharacterized protein LOC128234404 isoform X2 [Mya arenaria]